MDYKARSNWIEKSDRRQLGLLDSLDDLKAFNFKEKFFGIVSDGHLWDGEVVTDAVNDEAVAVFEENTRQNTEAQKNIQNRKGLDKGFFQTQYEEALGFLWDGIVPTAKVINNIGGQFNNGAIMAGNTVSSVYSIISNWQSILLGIVLLLIFIKQ